jgi:hypothetical protein
MPEDFEFLNQEDVINLYEKEGLNFGRPMLTVSSTFRVEELRKKFEQNNLIGLHEKIFDCRVLHHNQPGWRTGKMQVSVEVKFMPDEPIQEESLTEGSKPDEEHNPLEELRNLRGIENS